MQKLGPLVLAVTFVLPLGACQDALGFGDEPRLRQVESEDAAGAGGAPNSAFTETTGSSGQASSSTRIGSAQGGQEATFAAASGGIGGTWVSTASYTGGVDAGGGGVSQTRESAVQAMGGDGGSSNLTGGTSGDAEFLVIGGSLALGSGGSNTQESSDITATSTSTGGSTAESPGLGGAAGMAAVPSDGGTSNTQDTSFIAGSAAIAAGGSTAESSGLGGAAGMAAVTSDGGTSNTQDTSFIAGSAAIAAGGSTAESSGLGGAAGTWVAQGNGGTTDSGTAGSGSLAAGTGGTTGVASVSCTIDLTALEHDCDGKGPIRVMAISEAIMLYEGETIPSGETLASDWSLPDGMGKVRIDFANHHELEVRVEVDGPSGYVLDIGDSSSNDGGGGDWSTTSFDAELDVVERGFAQFPLLLFASDLNPGEASATQLANVSNFFVREDRTVRHLWISDRTVRLDSGQTWEHDALFRVSSSPPAPPDAFVYVGLNRVIDDMALWYQVRRVGCGVKKVTFWLR